MGTKWCHLTQVMSSERRCYWSKSEMSLSWQISKSEFHFYTSRRQGLLLMTGKQYGSFLSQINKPLTSCSRTNKLHSSSLHFDKQYSSFSHTCKYDHSLLHDDKQFIFTHLQIRSLTFTWWQTVHFHTLENMITHSDIRTTKTAHFYTLADNITFLLLFQAKREQLSSRYH